MRFLQVNDKNRLARHANCVPGKPVFFVRANR